MLQKRLSFMKNMYSNPLQGCAYILIEDVMLGFTIQG
jgi:hypothetical protein